MKISSVIIVIGLGLFASCKKISYAVDNPIVGIPTKVLMHRGN